MKILMPAILTMPALALAACSAPDETPLAGRWSVDAAQSRIGFITTKAGETVEAHRFADITGTVDEGGAAQITIGLDSVETGIDVRNERMREFLFQTQLYPAATVTAKIDPALFETLGSGSSVTLPMEGTLDLHGVSGAIASELIVTRIAPDKVKVETAAPVMIDAADFNLAQGVDQLRDLAGLPAITHQVPVQVSLVFAR